MHTPTPYHFAGEFKLDHLDLTRLRINGPNGDYVALTDPYEPGTRAGLRAIATARFIIRACNSYDAMLSALKDVQQADGDLTPELRESIDVAITLALKERT